MEDAIEHATATTWPTVGTALIAMAAGPSHFSATSASLFMHDFKLSSTGAAAARLWLPTSFFKPFATGIVHSTHFVSSVRVGKPAWGRGMGEWMMRNDGGMDGEDNEGTGGGAGGCTPA